MELVLTTRRWTIRIATTKPATKPATPAPSSVSYPMRASAAFTNVRSARPKDVR